MLFKNFNFPPRNRVVHVPSRRGATKRPRLHTRQGNALTALIPALWPDYPPKQVNVNEMHYDETDGGSFSHECRCGEAYVVNRGELREGFEVIDCTGCSLYLRVVGTPAETEPSTGGDR